MTTDESQSGPGLFSQTQIRHLMRTEFERAKRYSYPLACILLEIDGVGVFRDRAGFDAKEALLDDLIELLRQETRTCDYLGRLLDDRFLLVLPHTDPVGSATLARRLQELSGGLRPEGSDFEVRFSIGASHFGDGKPLFFDVLLEGAEEALGKAAGGLYVEATP
jgi:diguanylate cyclase (GGDEF)-like protein